MARSISVSPQSVRTASVAAKKHSKPDTAHQKQETPKQKQEAAKRKPIAVEAEPGFTAQTLTFLRGLAKNNDREWFEARRETYERALRAPMLELIARVNRQMEEFAPQHIKAPEKTVLRIYRDTRFSKSKLPYKQHYAAWWGRAGMVKTSGAGYYFHLSAKQLHIAAGLYMPDPSQTLLVRRYLLEHHEEFRSLLAARALKSRMQLSDPQKLTRAPKGFAADHPGNDVIFYRNWGVDVELAPEEALGPRFATTLAKYFEAAGPLVKFLNASLAVQSEKTRRPMFGLSAM